MLNMSYKHVRSQLDYGDIMNILLLYLVVGSYLAEITFNELGLGSLSYKR